MYKEPEHLEITHAVTGRNSVKAYGWNWTRVSGVRQQPYCCATIPPSNLHVHQSLQLNSNNLQFDLLLAHNKIILFICWCDVRTITLNFEFIFNSMNNPLKFCINTKLLLPPIGTTNYSTLWICLNPSLLLVRPCTVINISKLTDLAYGTLIILTYSLK